MEKILEASNLTATITTSAIVSDPEVPTTVIPSSTPEEVVNVEHQEPRNPLQDADMTAPAITSLLVSVIMTPPLPTPVNPPTTQPSGSGSPVLVDAMVITSTVVASSPPAAQVEVIVTL